ncbi:MAG: hypothetical protein FOGNACKC_05254 [Anaerolineae bacterium]|nr:hypothetical protein [Anaerolineae bacterium]
MKKRFVSLFLVMALLATAVTSAFAQADQDIVDTAVAAGSFTTLATALTEAGLIDTLKGEGPFTVFAPTDEAFAALPPGTLEGLLADKEALTNVLTYHVVPGKVMAADVVGLSSANSVEGSPIAISVVDGKVMLNSDATVAATDIEASNGVIHVIDKVILPPSMTAAAAPAQLPATGGEQSTTASTSLILLGVGLLLATTGAVFKWGFAHKR